MGILIGFKRTYIQDFKSDGTAAGALITLEGTQDEGATQEANISGMSADAVKVYGSNIPYYVSQKGTGDVSAELKLLDMPAEAENRILGYETDPDLKAQLIGENTEAPYCAVLLESEDTQGNVALYGFFKGKFSKPDVSLKTKEGGNVEPDGETYTYTPVTSDMEGKSKGQTMVKFLGTAEDAAAVKALVLRTGA